jgi:hypothetical protein
MSAWQINGTEKGKKTSRLRISCGHLLFAAIYCWWLVLICAERKVLLADCWWLICSERKVLLAGG